MSITCWLLSGSIALLHADALREPSGGHLMVGLLLVVSTQLALLVAFIVQRGWANARDVTDRKRDQEAIGRLEARNSAMLRVIPDVMFVLLRDGTFVDFHARDPALLFLPPERFMGRTIREVMPPDLAGRLMEAIERVCRGGDPVIIEYELSMNGPRCFEARLVYAECDRVLTIVRDVTESERVAAINRDLVGRLIASQEVERSRIARDLHDGVCQDVAAIGVDLSHLRHTRGDVQGRDVQESLLSVERRTAAVAETLRLLSHGLHPGVLQHVGLLAALRAHCAEVERQHRVQVRFFSEGEIEPASRLVALSLFRIAQEALRNCAKHGHARRATVSLVRGDKDLGLTVVDDGRGFDRANAGRSAGLGLMSIEERARLVQGRVTIDSRPGHGTKVSVYVPVDVADRPDAPQPEQARILHRSVSAPTINKPNAEYAAS